MTWEHSEQSMSIRFTVPLCELMTVAFLPPILMFPLSIVALFSIGFPIAFVGVTYFEFEAISSALLTVALCGFSFGGFLFLSIASILGYVALRYRQYTLGPSSLDNLLGSITWSTTVALSATVILRLIAIIV
jgi:hypothetical protein